MTRAGLARDDRPVVAPGPELVARFSASFDRLAPAGSRVGLAVSGGPDSMALLLLAATARPGKVACATVDHRLRPESAAEAATVAALCHRLGVPHETLALQWPAPPRSAIQEQARHRRYGALGGWARREGLTAVATGHQMDDQAETLLMRLRRGSGVRGLAAMREAAPLPGVPELRLLRPLLGWRRDELAALCLSSGVMVADDPSNADRVHERVRVRRAMAALDLGPAALARSAAALGQADEALDWAVKRAWDDRVRSDGPGGSLEFDPAGLPGEILRRLIERAIAVVAPGSPPPDGRELAELIRRLEAGGGASIRSLRCAGGPRWTFAAAPPRRPRKSG